MKLSSVHRLAIVLFAVTATQPLSAQTLLGSQGFDVPDMKGYTPRNYMAQSGKTAYITVGNPTDHFGFSQEITGMQGAAMVGVEDFDGFGAMDNPNWFDVDAIDVSGYEKLSVSVRIGAPGIDSYDETNFLRVEYLLDGADPVVVGQFVGSDAAADIKHDTNLDDVGDVTIGPGLVDYSFSIPETGSSLVIRVSFSSSLPDQEFGFDDVRVYGELPVPDASVPDANLPDASIPDASLPDASAPDASAPDATVIPDANVPDAESDASTGDDGDDGGCDCRTLRTSTSNLPWLALAVALVAQRRRRTR